MRIHRDTWLQVSLYSRSVTRRADDFTFSERLYANGRNERAECEETFYFYGAHSMGNNQRRKIKHACNEANYRPVYFIRNFFPNIKQLWERLFFHKFSLLLLVFGSKAESYMSPPDNFPASTPGNKERSLYVCVYYAKEEGSEGSEIQFLSLPLWYAMYLISSIITLFFCTYNARASFTYSSSQSLLS